MQVQFSRTPKERLSARKSWTSVPCGDLNVVCRPWNLEHEPCSPSTAVKPLKTQRVQETGRGWCCLDSLGRERHQSLNARAGLKNVFLFAHLKVGFRPHHRLTPQTYIFSPTSRSALTMRPHYQEHQCKNHRLCDGVTNDNVHEGGGALGVKQVPGDPLVHDGTH